MISVHMYRLMSNTVLLLQSKMSRLLPYLVVEAWAIIFPPIGFFGSAENIAAAPST